jgi:hypothetical protein
VEINLPFYRKRPSSNLIKVLEHDDMQGFQMWKDSQLAGKVKHLEARVEFLQAQVDELVKKSGTLRQDLEVTEDDLIDGRVQHQELKKKNFKSGAVRIVGVANAAAEGGK